MLPLDRENWPNSIRYAYVCLVHRGCNMLVSDWQSALFINLLFNVVNSDAVKANILRPLRPRPQPSRTRPLSIPARPEIHPRYAQRLTA